MAAADSGRGLERCGPHGLTYDPAVASGCVLCRQEAGGGGPPRRSASPGWALVVVGVAVTVTGVGAAMTLLPRPDEPGVAPKRPEGKLLDLQTRNEAGRSGSVYFPPVSGTGPLPVLVALHGTGGVGQNMVEAFRELADEHGFVIVAPSSRKSPEGVFTWQVGDTPGDITPDFTHVVACLEEVQGHHGDRLDPKKVLIAGYSGGASSAPYVATNDPRFGAFAVLHGGVFTGGFGTHRVRGWFSTGATDSTRSPRQVEDAAEDARRKGLDVTFQVFTGSHDLGYLEREALVKWWLDVREGP